MHAPPLHHTGSSLDIGGFYNLGELVPFGCEEPGELLSRHPARLRSLLLQTFLNLRQAKYFAKALLNALHDGVGRVLRHEHCKPLRKLEALQSLGE